MPKAGGSLGSAVRTVAGWTLISRVLGLARDLLIARAFLDTPIASAFAAAFALPNLFRRLFGEGALAAAFVPAYAEAHEDDRSSEPPNESRNDADRLVSLTAALVGGVTALLTVVGELILLALLVLLPESGERGFSFALMMLLLPYMPLVCVTAVLGGALHVHGRFAPTAAAPVVLNIAMIVAGASHFLRPDADVRTTAVLVAIAALVAGVVQVAWSVYALRGHVCWTRGVREVYGRARAMLARFVPAAIGLGAVQINSFLDTLIAMWPVWVGPTMLGRDYPLDERANGVLFFTQRLYQFPLGVFGIAVATAVFPLLARTARDAGAFRETLARGVRLSLFIGLPASAGLALVAPDLVRGLFGGGGAEVSFSAEGLLSSERVLVAYAAGVWAYALNHVLARAFYALSDTATPTKVTLAMVVLNLGLNLTLIWPLGVAGLAWSTAACACVQALILSLLLRRRLGRGAGSGVARGIAVTLALTGVMAGAVWAVASFIGPRDGWGEWVIGTIAIAITGLAVFGVGAVATRRPEVRWLLARRAGSAYDRAEQE